MHPKLTELTETRFTPTTSRATPPSAPTSSPYMEDNFLMHLAPVSIGVFFFGNFHPNVEDKVQAQRALYKTSFLYRHFLQPGGLKVVIDDKCLTLTGKTASTSVSLMAHMLGTQIMGLINVVDETTRVEEVSRSSKAESGADAELRARLQLMLATDSRLCSEGIVVVVNAGNAKVTGQVTSSENKSWAESLLRSVASEAKMALHIASHKVITAPPKSPISIDDDSLQALALTRLKLVPSFSRLEIKVSSQRQALVLSGSAPAAVDKTLAESIVKNTYGLREFKSNLNSKG